jgi:hypothetical protein
MLATNKAICLKTKKKRGVIKEQHKKNKIKMKKKKITLCSVSVLLSEEHFLGKLLCPLTLDTGTKVSWLERRHIYDKDRELYNILAWVFDSNQITQPGYLGTCI